MKKSSKIILLVLALSLLIGGVIGISASADTVAPEIISKNVKTDGNFCLMFAVDPATVAGDEVTITVYNQNPADLDADALAEATVQTITKAKTDTETIALGADGVKDDVVIVFETLGVAAKDIADVWYVKTESAEKSKIVTYSVREYAFERLYKDGTVNATENDADLKKFYQKQFYLELLDMGSAAQELHVNYKLVANGKTPERLAKEYTYAFIKDGSYSIGDAEAVSYGFVEVGDMLTLNGETGWNVYTYGQNGGPISTQTVATGSTIEVAGNMIITPYEVGVTAGKYFDEIGNPVYKMNGLDWKNFYGNSPSTMTPDKWYFGHTNFSTNSCAYLLKDSGFAKYGYIIGGSKPSVESGATGTQCLLHFPIAEETTTEANCVVFEFDFYYDGADVYYNKEADSDSGTVYFIMSEEDLAGATGENYNTLTKTISQSIKTIDLDGVKVYDETTKCYKSEKGTNALRLPGVTDSKYDLVANTWYNICFEVYTDANKCLVYIDGVCVGSFNLKEGTTIDNYNSASLMVDARFRNVEFYMDNVCGAKIVKEYKAQ